MKIDGVKIRLDRLQNEELAVLQELLYSRGYKWVNREKGFFMIGVPAGGMGFLVFDKTIDYCHIRDFDGITFLEVTFDAFTEYLYFVINNKGASDEI